MTKFSVGDVVAIDGTKRRNISGQCAYLPEQLTESGLLKHTGTGAVWTGQIERIQGTMAFVSGGWRGLQSLVLIRKGRA